MAQTKNKAQKSKVAIPAQENNSVWATVTGAAVDFMETVDGGMTKDEVVQGVIASGKASLIPSDTIEELVESMLLLFVGNGIMVNNGGVYVKRTLEDTPFGKRGIVIERAENVKKEKNN